MKCPECGSPSPERHPALQWEGEVHICTHDFHLQDTPQARPYHALVLERRATHGGKGEGDV